MSIAQPMQDKALGGAPHAGGAARHHQAPGYAGVRTLPAETPRVAAFACGARRMRDGIAHDPVLT